MKRAATAPEPQVVHSGFGRLRVHLPDPGGLFTARFRLYPGVTSAQANDLTGNILILFNPRQTTAQALLAELRLAGVAAPAIVPQPRTPGGPLLAAVPQEARPHPRRQVVYVTGARGRLYKLLGWSSVGMAVVGAILPGIPTAPFVVLASYFFIRSSPTAHAWLLRSRWFGPILRDWEERRGVKRSVKYTAVGMMAAGATVTVLLGLPAPVVASILALEGIGLVIVLRLPEVEPSAPPPALATL
jgi:uncharacterized membrane protein YbaN (DUF454 family)